MHENRKSLVLPASATLSLAARAKALALAGKPVVSMAVGEPDFSAPKAARDAAIHAIESGLVRYTPAAGTPTLRAAIARHVSETRGIPVTPSQVVVGHSCKHVLSNALLLLIEPGDEVLLFSPAWNSYEAQVEFAEGKAVWVPSLPNLRPDFAAIRAAIGPKTRGMVLNTPTNPTGCVWNQAEIEAIAQLAEEHDLWIVSDEIYRRLVYRGTTFHSPTSLSPAIAARTVIVDGASKTYSMTGYRIGFAVAPAFMADAIERMSSQMTGCPNYISQMALEAVIGTEPPEVAAMHAQFEARRDTLIPGLRRIGLEVEEPGGAFYAFPSVREHLKGRTVEEFCLALLEEQSLAVVPGTTFGSHDHIRLSYALGMADIEEALRRLERFLA